MAPPDIDLASIAACYRPITHPHDDGLGLASAQWIEVVDGVPRPRETRLVLLHGCFRYEPLQPLPLCVIEAMAVCVTAWQQRHDWED